MVFEYGVDPGRLELVYNGVSMDRFERRPPLPSRPARALVFSNAAREFGFVHEVRTACSRVGIQVDVVGAASGASVAATEEVLGGYDLVFAKGRAAIEAMASGCAVILCDDRGLGEMVTSRSAERLRALNFGARTLSRDNDVDAIGAEIERYDPADAAVVTDYIRREAGAQAMSERMIEIYESALAVEPATVDWQGEARQLARYLPRVERRMLDELGAFLDAAPVRLGRKALASPQIAPMLRVIRRVLKS
jgi:hypothetical protein